MAERTKKPGLGKEKMEQMVMEFRKKLEDALKKKGVRKPNGSTLMEIAHMDYQPAFSQKEKDGKTYHYPESMFFNINSWDTFKVELRADGEFVKEGQDVNGPGIPQDQIIEEVVQNVADWSEHVKKRTEVAPKQKGAKWKTHDPQEYSGGQMAGLILSGNYGDGWGVNVKLHGSGFWIEIHNGYDTAEEEYVKRDRAKTFGDMSYVKEAADKLHDKVVQRRGLPKVSAMPREMNAMLAKIDPKKYPTLAGAFKNLTIAENEGHLKELEKEAKSLEDKHEKDLTPEDKKRLEELGKEIETEKRKSHSAAEEAEAGAKEQEIIKRWVADKGGDFGGPPMAAWAKGDTLYSYNTIIAKFEGGKLYVNSTKYSNTTSKLVNHLKAVAQGAGIRMEETDETFFKTSMPEKLDFGRPEHRSKLRSAAGVEDEVDEMADEPSEDDAFLSDSGPLGSRTSVSVGGKFLGEFNSEEEAEEALKAWMKANNYWPAVWYIDDHGGINPRTIGVEASIVKAEFTLDVTYDVVTPESAERGDFEESGHEAEDLKFDTLAEMALYIQEHGGSGSETGGGIQNPSWYTADAEMDYETGHSTTYGFHVQTDLTQEQADELQRYMDMDERELRKMVREAEGAVGAAKKEKWIIKDWAGNEKFNGKSFDSFDDGEEFLSEHLGDNYETDRQEFDVVLVKSNVTATGEPDQDYDHETYDAIVKALEAKGYKARHTEFDKYQGVFLDVAKDMVYKERFWTIDSFVRGKTKDTPEVKYRSAVLIDMDGNSFSANPGDYFQMKPEDTFEGSILVLKGMDGKETEIQDPKKKDLPPDNEVQGDMQFEGEPSTVLILGAESQGSEPEPIEVTVTPDGHAEISELLAFLGKAKKAGKGKNKEARK